MFQWLGLHDSTAGGTGSVAGQGTKILQAAWHGHKKNEAMNLIQFILKREREELNSTS